MSAQITVGILTRNSAQTIETTLQSLREQTLPTSEWSVFCVDHDSTDGTDEILEKFLSETSAGLLHRDSENNLAKSRQFILEKSSTPWVAFLDSDVVLPSDWLQTALMRAQQLAPTAGVGAPLRLQPRSPQLNALTQIQQNPIGHFYSQQMWIPEQPMQVQHLTTSAALFNRNQVLAVGGFDSNFRRVGEDLELGIRLTRSGQILWVLPELLAHHQITTSTRNAWFQRSFRFGQARLQVLRKHPRLLKSPLSWIPLGLFFFSLLLLITHPLLFFGFLFSHFLVLFLLFRSASTALFAQGTQLSYSYGQGLGILFVPK